VTKHTHPIPRAAGPSSAPASARADIDQVIEIFWSEFAQDERYWWWPRAAWTDPNELIVDDDEGSLWRVPFSSNEDQEVTFEEPVRVLQQFVDAPATASAAAFSMHRERPAATYHDRSEAGRKAKKPEGSRASATKSAMDRAEYIASLGLSPDATDAQIAQAAIAAATNDDPPADPPADPPQDPQDPPADPPADPPQDPDPSDPPADPADPPADPPAASGETVTLDRGTYEEMRAGARDGAAARAEQVNERRENLIRAAIEDGRIPPARADHWRELHKADAAGTEDLLGRLEAGVVPVTERGSSSDPVASGNMSSDQFAADMSRLFGPAYAPPANGGQD